MADKSSSKYLRDHGWKRQRFTTTSKIRLVLWIDPVTGIRFPIENAVYFQKVRDIIAKEQTHVG